MRKLFLITSLPLLMVSQLVAGGSFLKFSPNHRTITDFGKLTRVPISRIYAPKSIEQLAQQLPHMKLPISVAGGRYSQGGQIAARNGTVIDITHLNKIIKLDLNKKQITVQSGITWRKIQEAIDPHNLSVWIMQSYADFTVGGALSVNCHGRGIGCGPIGSSVVSLKIMDANGTLHKATRTKNSDLFHAAIGGYGYVGIIVEATLQLVDNLPLERKVKTVSLKNYTSYFLKQINTNPHAVFHNGNLYPSAMNQVTCVTWYTTNKKPTIQDRLQPIKPFYAKEMLTEQLYRRSKLIQKTRAKLEPTLLKKEMIVWRNHEMSYTVKAHEPLLRFPTTTVLQEYFVPVAKLEQFVHSLEHTIKKYNINMLNISIRYVPRDTQSALAYARQDSFALVLYFNMANTRLGRDKARSWTRKLTDHALKLGGSYYLPYQLYATQKQFDKAYPQLGDFLKVKTKYDPKGAFSNELFATYGAQLFNPIRIITIN